MQPILSVEQVDGVPECRQAHKQRPQQPMLLLVLLLVLLVTANHRRAGDHWRQLAGVAGCDEVPGPGAQQRHEAGGLGHLGALVQQQDVKSLPHQQLLHGLQQQQQQRR
jgi:hypothetical protein